MGYGRVYMLYVLYKYVDIILIWFFKSFYLDLDLDLDLDWSLSLFQMYFKCTCTFGPLAPGSSTAAKTNTASCI